MGVIVGVLLGVGVIVGVGVMVGVNVWVGVWVAVGVCVEVGVILAVDVFVGVVEGAVVCASVEVGVGVGLPDQAIPPAKPIARTKRAAGRMVSCLRVMHRILDEIAIRRKKAHQATSAE